MGVSVLHLLRHAPVQLATGVCYGASDVEAQALSTRELRELRENMSSRLAVWSSPLRRCRSLAEDLFPASAGLRIDARLSEMHFGEWELRRFDDIDRALIDAWAADPWHFIPPGGESAAAMSVRVLAVLHDLLRDLSQDEALIVAHAGPLRVIRGTLLGLPREHWLNQPCPPASLETLRLESR